MAIRIEMQKLILSYVALVAFAVPAFAGTTITVTHGVTPAPVYIDLGPAGDSAGDQRIWEFGGKTDSDEPVMMDWIMTTTGQPDAAAMLESRITSAVFSFGAAATDRILVQGIGKYPMKGSTVKIDATLERAVIGGTGKYAGATGTVTTTHLDDGTWRHVINIQ